MGKTKKKMFNNGCVVTRRSRPVLKPQISVRSKRAVRNFDALTKNSNHSQGIFYNRKASGHNSVFDTGSQQSMIGRDVWEIVRRHDMWIYAGGVYLGVTPKAGRRLQLVDARGVAKNLLDGNSYLVILS